MDNLAKLMTTVRTAARIRYRKQFPRVWVVITDTCSRAVIINAMTKDVVESATGACAEDALDELRKKMMPDIKKAGP